MFVRVTSYVLYFISFFHCDLHNPSNISPIHTMIHSFCTSYSPKYCSPYSIISIEIPCSIRMFIKHIVLLALVLHFTNQRLQIIDFLLPFMLISFLYKSLYFNEYAHWVLFHGMLLSIIHSQPMIILLLLECFLYRLNH